jgi:hypothetical protein
MAPLRTALAHLVVLGEHAIAQRQLDLAIDVSDTPPRFGR